MFHALCLCVCIACVCICGDPDTGTRVYACARVHARVCVRVITIPTSPQLALAHRDQARGSSLWEKQGHWTEIRNEDGAFISAYADSVRPFFFLRSVLPSSHPAVPACLSIAPKDRRPTTGTSRRAPKGFFIFFILMSRTCFKNGS